MPIMFGMGDCTEGWPVVAGAPVMPLALEPLWLRQRGRRAFLDGMTSVFAINGGTRLLRRAPVPWFIPENQAREMAEIVTELVEAGVEPGAWVLANAACVPDDATTETAPSGWRSLLARLRR